MSLTVTGFAGWCPWPRERLAQEAVKGASVAQLPGDFVFSYKLDGPDGETQEGLVSSLVAAVPYYWHADRQKFTHGPNVFDVARRAGLRWQWNPRAVNSMALFEHTLGEDTLHPEVRRVRPGCHYVWRNGRLDVSQDPAVSKAFQQPEDISVDEVLSCITSVLNEMVAGRNVAISLSAGYDSRALLAMVVKAGVSPLIFTMGREESTDVKVARSLAHATGTSHSMVRIDESDYLRLGRQIASTTSGVKSAAHWHTWLFARAAGFPAGTLHLAGANGELARSYYFDKGALASALDLAGGSWTCDCFLRAKYRLSRKWPRSPASGFLAADEKGESVKEALELAGRSCHGPKGFLRQMDQFYVMTRVRHFIGGGIASYQHHVDTASPFLDGRFVLAAARLPRRWKQNSRFHRRLIRHACQSLLDEPTDESGVSMRNQDRPFYWLKRSRMIEYSPLGSLLSSAAVKELVMESPWLDQFLARKHREELLTHQNRQLLCFLITMHFASLEAMEH